MSCLVISQEPRFAISLWKGKDDGPFSDYNIEHEIYGSKKAIQIFTRFSDNLQFINLMSSFLKKYPCRVTLFGLEDSFTLPKIKRVVSAIEKVLDCEARLDGRDESRKAYLKAFKEWMSNEELILVVNPIQV